MNIVIGFIAFVVFILFIIYQNKKRDNLRKEYIRYLILGDEIIILNPNFYSDYKYLKVIFIGIIEENIISVMYKNNYILIPINLIDI